ncbi:family 20 glycosylhydrolase [Streptomyces sp. NPDC079020]|uniref:family 20 glycosylhydrolase n=1 Tax=Streptomyces sp. NPDC079020 TaxID=3365722 RepID=UPI0037D2B757
MTDPLTGTFPLSATTSVTVTDPGAVTAYELFRERLTAWTGVRLGRATTTAAAPDGRAGDRPGENTLLIEVSEQLPELDALPVPRGIRPSADDAIAERFQLTITPTGVTVRATAYEGIHRGLVTLAQLAVTGGDPDGEEDTVRLPCARILDSPRFAWRGLSLDVARCFLGVEAVERVIDLLDLYKLNTLHLHLTDDPGWRVQLPSRPGLTDHPAAGPSYTRADYARIVTYAAARFITVVPEIDMPGHSGAALRAHPELGVKEQPENPGVAGFAQRMPDPESASTWSFVEDVIGDIAELTPGRFIHIGGDEAFAMSPDAHAAFVGRAAAVVAGAGKEVAGWQEIARGDLPPRSVVQYWIELDRLREVTGNGTLGEILPGVPLEMVLEQYEKSAADLPRAREQNAWVLLSPVSATYLDRRYAEVSCDPAQEPSRQRIGHRGYPPAAVRESLEWDPDTLTDQIAPDRIAGVEAAVWGETVSDENDVHLLLLPRLPLIAERAWTLAPTPWATLRERLARQTPLWRAPGFTWYAGTDIPWAEAVPHSVAR